MVGAVHAHAAPLTCIREPIFLSRHRQTINLDDDLTLCDCPGLVFPAFATTAAELVCNGILPVDQMRDGIPPVTLVRRRLRRRPWDERGGRRAR